MLKLSREAKVKIGKHAWNVFPLEAFGFLLGSPSKAEILASLPCSKTSTWNRFDDRWNGIAVSMEIANRTAEEFGLDVVGIYGSTEVFRIHELPEPDLTQPTKMGLVLIYHNISCPSCSGISIYQHGHRLNLGDDYSQSKGKRLRPEINQKRV